MAARVVFVVVVDALHRRRVAGDLARAGLTVVSMGGGRAAVEWVRAARPALVVSDLAVLEHESSPLAQRLRAYPETRELPIVTVGPEVERGRAQAAGCTAFTSDALPQAALAALAISLLGTGPAAPSCLG